MVKFSSALSFVSAVIVAATPLALAAPLPGSNAELVRRGEFDLASRDLLLAEDPTELTSRDPEPSPDPRGGRGGGGAYRHRELDGDLVRRSPRGGGGGGHGGGRRSRRELLNEDSLDVRDVQELIGRTPSRPSSSSSNFDPVMRPGAKLSTSKTKAVAKGLLSYPGRIARNVFRAVGNIVRKHRRDELEGYAEEVLSREYFMDDLD